MTYVEGLRLAKVMRARVVEVVYVNGGCRLNVVLRNGRPRTLVVDRP
jgi:hypothetical protein